MNKENLEPPAVHQNQVQETENTHEFTVYALFLKRQQSEHKGIALPAFDIKLKASVVTVTKCSIHTTGLPAG